MNGRRLVTDWGDAYLYTTITNWRSVIRKAAEKYVASVFVAEPNNEIKSIS
jgi:hypothetical protein